jgi:hypothetical protein
VGRRTVRCAGEASNFGCLVARKSSRSCDQVWAPATGRRRDVKSSVAWAVQVTSRRGEPDASSSAGMGSGSSTSARRQRRSGGWAAIPPRRFLGGDVPSETRACGVASTGPGARARRRVQRSINIESANVGVESTGVALDKSAEGQRSSLDVAPHTQYDSFAVSSRQRCTLCPSPAPFSLLFPPPFLLPCCFFVPCPHSVLF